jgi:hypothetical protein
MTTEELQEYADDPTYDLLAAVRAGDLPLVTELVRKGAAVYGDPLGLSPIAVAILTGRPDCAWLLLKLGARPVTRTITTGLKKTVVVTHMPSAHNKKPVKRPAFYCASKSRKTGKIRTQTGSYFYDSRC